MHWFLLDFVASARKIVACITSRIRKYGFMKLAEITVNDTFLKLYYTFNDIINMANYDVSLSAKRIEIPDSSITAQLCQTEDVNTVYRYPVVHSVTLEKFSSHNC